MIYQPPSKQTLIARNANSVFCEKKRILSILESIREKQNYRASYTAENAYRELGSKNEMSLIGFRHLLSKGFTPYESVSAAKKIPPADHPGFQGLAFYLPIAEQEAEKYKNLLLETDRLERLMLAEAQAEIKTARKNIRQLINESHDQ